MGACFLCHVHTRASWVQFSISAQKKGRNCYSNKIKELVLTHKSLVQFQDDKTHAINDTNNCVRLNGKKRFSHYNTVITI